MMPHVDAILVAAGIGLVAFGAVGYVAWRAGIFARLRVIERSFGPFVLLYNNVTGPYSECHTHCQRLASMVVEDARLVHVSAWGVSAWG